MPDTSFDAQATRRFYDRISRAYDLISDSGEHEARLKGIDMLRLVAGEQVLDIGYGTGNAVVELAKRVGPTGVVCGIDLSLGMQAVALEKVRASGTAASVRLDVGSALTLPYEDGTFDAVYMSFTLELFPDTTIPRVLAEVTRVLRPGGRLAMVAMAAVRQGEHESPLEHVYKWTHHHFPHIVDCRPIDVEDVVARAGFTITASDRMGIFTMPVATVLGTRA